MSHGLVRIPISFPNEPHRQRRRDVTAVVGIADSVVFRRQYFGVPLPRLRFSPSGVLVTFGALHRPKYWYRIRGGSSI
jgi:hypothetical protein